MPSFDEYGSGWDPTSPNVARMFSRMEPGSLSPQDMGPGAINDRWGGSGTATGHDDPDLLTRIWRSLFGPRKQPGITQQPLAPPPGAQASTSPFGGVSPVPAVPAQQAKPATQLSSNKAITDRINSMLAPPPEAAPVGMADFYPGAGGAGTAPMSYMARAPGLQEVPFDLFQSGPTPNRMSPGRIDMRRSVPRQEDVRSPFMPAGGNGAMIPPMYSHGGGVPGFMRGGYPDLYGVDEPPGVPERSFFDSGGENRYVDNGTGSGGRADDVNAKLSEKEYVMTAEDMALLGDGNPDAGAKKMDAARVELRKQKGKELAKGKISSDAKPALLSYVAGNPMGAGLRRRGRERG